MSEQPAQNAHAGGRQVRAAGYCRVSTDEQAQHGHSIGDQARLIAERCDAEGWALTEVYSDPGRSGADPDRPELNRLLADLDDLDVVVVWANDRLTRDLALFVSIAAQLTTAKVRLVSLTAHVDLETPEGEAMANIAAVFGQFERKRTAERVKASKAARALAGGHPGGRRPYGYTFAPTGETGKHGKPLTRLAPDPVEAPILLGIFESADSGVSQRRIARRLADEGVRGPRGKLIAQARIAAWLANPLYKGIIRRRVGDGWELHPGQHPAIVPEALWDRVNASRASTPRRAGGRPKLGRHLLGGRVFRCGQCGSAMIAVNRPERDGQQAYLCVGHRDRGSEFCSQLSVRRELVDAALLTELTSRYIDLDATRRRLEDRQRADVAIARDTVAHAERDLADADARLARIRRGWQSGVLDDDEFQAQRSDVSGERDGAQAAVAQARARVDAIEAAGPLKDSEQALLGHLADLKASVAGAVGRAPDLEALRTVIGQLFERVEISANPFGPKFRSEAGVWDYAQPRLRTDENGEPLQEDLDALPPPSALNETRLWLHLEVRHEAYDFAGKTPHRLVIDVPKKPTRPTCRRN